MSLSGAPIDERLLTRYMEHFVGFGSYKAALWFVGMEQGGGRDLKELARRLEAWRSLGEGDVIDFAAYCALLHEERWHGPEARIQPTLGKMIRVVLAAHGKEASAGAVREYQSERFGRAGDESLVAELFPLPSRSVGEWIYRDVCNLACLKDRQAYLMEFRPKRAALLRHLIDQHAPRVVVMLGWSYRDAWEELIEVSLVERDEPQPGLLFGRRGKTAFVVCHHPTSFGVTNAYFTEIGRIIGSGS